MAERSSTFNIAFSGDASDIESVLAGIKSKFKSAIADLESTTKRVTLFEGLSEKTKASADALALAAAKAKELNDQLEKVKASGGKATDDLAASTRKANQEFAAATREYNRNVDALTKLENQLTRAGVDTSDLTKAQQKLTEATKAATAAAAEQAAKQALGLKTLSDVKPQIDKLNAAYITLRDSGKLSSSELLLAQVQLRSKISETNAEVTKFGSSLKTAFAGGAGFLSGIGPGFLGVAAAVAAVGTAISASIDAARDFRQQLAEISTVSNLSRAELDQLGLGARQLARTIGFDVTEGMKALFEIIRSGVPPGNALDVLAVSAEAAKASLTDVGVTAKISTALMDSFGLEVGDLRDAFDKLIRGAHDGGATLKEFSESASPLLTVAREAKVPFDDLVAVLTVMTDKSNDAQGSISALTKIIVQLGDPNVRAKLHALGIDSTNLLQVFRQLGERGIPLQQILDLGLGSARAAAGVAALTTSAGDLVPELEKIKGSAGEAKKSIDELANAGSPKQRADALKAELKEFEIAVGNAFGEGSRLQVLETAALRLVNDFIAGVRELGPAGDEAKGGLDKIAGGAKSAADAAAAADAAIKPLIGTLTTASAALLATAQALQAGAARDIADIETRAAAQIAALDRSAQAQAASAERAIAIQAKLAADRLALIQKNEAEVTDAVNAGLAAREKAASESEKKTQRFAAETAKIRLDALAPIVAQYQDHYSKLIALGQGYRDKINAIEQDRVEFNRGVEKQLFDIRLSGLSGIDQYAAKVQEADRLIAAARLASVNGDIANAKRFLTEALAISSTLTTVVNKDGQTVIGAFELQGTKLRLAKDQALAYNEALDREDVLAKEGAEATKKGLDEVVPKLEAVQKQYDELKKTVESGLLFKAVIDEQSLARVSAELDELTKDRTVKIKFETVGPSVPISGGQFGGTGTTGEFNRGGLVGAIQRFAAGGSVFRRPSWTKVPGAGNSDTVPAALPIGSYVLRKAAALRYGDSALGRLARGYASGGPVEPAATPARFASGGIADTWRQIHDAKVQAEQSFFEILSRATGLPRGTIGQDVRDYVARVLELIRRSQDLKEIQGYIDRVLNFYNAFSPAIEDAKRWHVPLVLGAFISGASPPSSPSPTANKNLSQLEKSVAAGGLFSRTLGSSGGIFRFAAGGPATDTIPAMLTPGEFVVRPQVVANLGVDFMHALNSMAIPKGAFDRFMNIEAPRPSVPHFAEGGLVASAGGSSTSTTRPATTESAVTVNIYTQTVDRDALYRDIIPGINKALRRSR